MDMKEENRNGAFDHWMITESERNFDFYSWRSFANQNIHVPIIGSCLYLITLFALKKWMKNRTSMTLKKTYIIWNSLLAIFSIITAIRFVPESYILWRRNGWHKFVCVEPNFNGVRGFWILLFTLSKFVELGDSFFIVLRKKKLHFLQYFHHGTAIICVWLGLAEPYSLTTIFMPMNAVVHAILYSFEALKTMGHRLPGGSALVIAAEIMHVVVAFYASLYVLSEKMYGRPCELSNHLVFLSLSFYPIFAFLFLKYFIRICARVPIREISPNQNSCLRDTNNNGMKTKIF